MLPKHPLYHSETPGSRMIVTTAGDLEREAKSRRYNLIEALGMMTFILVMLWPIAYVFGVLGGCGAVKTTTTLFLAGGAGYVLFVSPFIHKDTLSSWGLGNPRTLLRMLREGSPARRLFLGLTVTALFLALNYANYARWPDVVKFLELNDAARFFGANTPAVQRWKEGFPGVLAVAGFGCVLSAVIVTCAIRYDNFLAAFRTALIIALPLLCVIISTAVLHRGAAVFRELQLSEWALGVLGYVFWGFVQQLLFSSYFGTRLRKAFAPSVASGNMISREKRGRTVLAFAVGGAAAAFFLTVLILRYRYGAESASMRLAGGVALCIAPLGALYGYFYGLDRKRLLVATLSASCFGLIHIDSYFLVAITWGLGIILVYVFMEDRNRNLVALGFIHGLGGSTFNALFSQRRSGLLEVDYSVGPWNVDHPSPGVLVFPMLCLGIYLAVTVWAAVRIDERAR